MMKVFFRHPFPLFPQVYLLSVLFPLGLFLFFSQGTKDPTGNCVITIVLLLRVQYAGFFCGRCLLSFPPISRTGPPFFCGLIRYPGFHVDFLMGSISPTSQFIHLLSLFLSASARFLNLLPFPPFCDWHVFFKSSSGRLLCGKNPPGDPEAPFSSPFSKRETALVFLFSFPCSHFIVYSSSTFGFFGMIPLKFRPLFFGFVEFLVLFPFWEGFCYCLVTFVSIWRIGLVLFFGFFFFSPFSFFSFCFFPHFFPPKRFIGFFYSKSIFPSKP